MRYDEKFSYYGIKEDDYIYIIIRSKGGGNIDNLKEESKREITKKIGFDMN